MPRSVSGRIASDSCCGSGPGSGAIETEIRSSPPTCWPTRFSSRRPWRSAITCNSCGASPRSCRCRHGWSSSVPTVQQLADAAGDTSPYRLDEPYRQALRGMHARLAATAMCLIGQVPSNPPIGERPPYGTPSELLADLDVIEAALHQHGAHAVANGRLTALRGAVETFGFHLATVDLRQNSAVHEQAVDELLRIGGVCAQLWRAR